MQVCEQQQFLIKKLNSGLELTEEEQASTFHVMTPEILFGYSNEERSERIVKAMTICQTKIDEGTAKVR